MEDYFKNSQSLKIPGTSYTIRGNSRAARYTCFYIDELNIMFDCGINNQYIPDHIFLTHGHSDHSSNIPMNLVELGNSKNNVTKKPVIYIPAEIEKKIFNYIDSFYSLSKNTSVVRIHSKYDLKGLKANDVLVIEIKKKTFHVDIIGCHHSVPCIGYGFSEKRIKLKEEYKNLSTKELTDFKKNNVMITEIVILPLFCYLGDTTIDVFKNELIKKYPVIFVECTFILDDDFEHAAQKSHIHWKSLEPIVRNNPEKTFILYHFSNKYTVEIIMDFFKKTGHTNIHPWV